MGCRFEPYLWSQLFALFFGAFFKEGLATVSETVSKMVSANETRHNSTALAETRPQRTNALLSGWNTIHALT
jgi:hypothetical protein